MSTRVPRSGCCVDRKYGSPRGCTPATCMVLPEGRTCDECAHNSRCRVVFGFTNLAGRRICDWHPRRFRLAVVHDDDAVQAGAR